MKFKARNENQIITTDTTIKADGFTKIFFRNDGDDLAKIDGNIDLTVHTVNADNNTFLYVEPPYVEQQNDVIITFEGTGTIPKVLLIKTYYDEIR